MRQGTNAIEEAKVACGGDALRIRDELPAMIQRGFDSLTKVEKDLLKWVGVFARVRTPGRFMMRIRMPNGFATSEQLRAIAEVSRRFGNSIMDLTTRQQVEIRGFTIETVPEIWEKLRTVDLHSIQTGMDNVRNINGCPLAGLTPHELLDASPVVFELDRLIVGSEGNPEFTNLPRKLNVTIRQLHALRIAGCGPRSGRRGRASGVQRAGRRQDGLGRIHRRVAARRVRRPARRRRDCSRTDPHLPGPRAPRCARQMPVRIFDR